MPRPTTRLLAATVALAGIGLAATASSAGVARVDVRAYAASHGLTAASAPTTRSAVDLPATPQLGCAKGDRPETGRQGRVPGRDYTSGRAAKGYTCNASVVGHEGSSGGFRVERYVDRSGRECAFYDTSTIFLGNAAAGKDSGVVAVDMSDPAKPKRTAVLRTYAMQTPHESLRLHAGRGLLVAVGGSPVTNAGIVDVYDVSKDCRAPQLLSTLPISFLGHEGGFSPDGKTYWAAATADRGITPIDLTDPSAPKPLTVITGYASHGLSISADGNRAYLAEPQGNYVSVTTGSG
ncbi:MAG: hypothetical protein JWN17_779, partial [Frankiales bacterium]|nr:hypothetical protein [Frankiales bacterium]